MTELDLDDGDMDEEKHFEFDYMKPNIVALKREKQFMDHVYKCFTFGKPVRRDTPLVKQGPSNIDEIKRKFNRVRLIRSYFSVKRQKKNRKFDYPVDHMGRILSENFQHDYQQYCIESDHEHEYPRRSKADEINLLKEVSELKKQ